MTEQEHGDRSLDDRDAKILIGVMLVLQVTFLLSTIVWF